MTTYLVLSIIGMAWFSAGLALLLNKFGIPPSLSESYYNIGGKQGKGYLFYLYLAVTVFVMLAPMVEAAQYWGFLCGVGLLFVGAAPAFKRDNDDRGSLEPIIHPIGAAVCGLSSLMVLINVTMWWWAIITLAICGFLAWKTETVKSSYVYWIEMTAFYALFAGMITYNSTL